MKPKSQFATALTLLIDESKLCERKQWAEILGVTEAAISQWVNDKTLPRPEFLSMILNTIKRNANRVPKGIIEEFDHIAGKPAAEVTPLRTESDSRFMRM
jgi:predicted transcriptional regulator